MGYKKYSDIGAARVMIDNIKRGYISSRNTAYRELFTIANEWPGTPEGREAERLIDSEYSDQKYSS